jgi:aminoglycoside phosphotransferase (APT) family kinase protein
MSEMKEANPYKPHLEDEARHIVQKVTGSSVSEARQIARGVMTYKFFICVKSGQSYVVRFYPPSRSHVVDYEPDLLRRCAEAGAKVPCVIADSRTGPRSVLQYVVYTMVDGLTLSERIVYLSSCSLQRLCEQVVENLVMLRQLRFSGVGELMNGENARSHSWRQFVKKSFLEGLQSLRDNRLVGDRLLRNTERLQHRIDEILLDDLAGSTLTYADLGPDNIIVDDDGKLAGLIDFEGTLVGDSVLALGYCYSAYGDDPFVEHIASAWPETLEPDAWRRIYLYAILRPLRVGKYAHMPLPTGEPRKPLTEVFPGFEPSLNKLI